MCKSVRIVLYSVLVLVFIACANRSRGPQGGPKDITPPTPKKATPVNNTTNFKGNKFEIAFSELVNVNNAYENVIISPIQTSPATIRTTSNRVTVILNDTIKPNTTYTVDFGNSIVDVNERNPLVNYCYTFSTGATLDTMQISGTVLDAGNLNPVQGIYVGIYDPAEDSIFVKTKPLRIARTNENGEFSMKGIKKGTYKVFALGDLGNDFIYNAPTERIAFLDNEITPSIEEKTVTDTIVIKNETDTTKSKKDFVQRKKTIFLPNDIVLRAFKEDVYKQQIAKFERTDPYKISLFFASPNMEKPSIKPLNFTESAIKGLVYNTRMDSITCWIESPTVYDKDTLRFAVTYRLSEKEMKTDTISAIYKKKTKKSEKDKDKVPVFLRFTSNIQNPMDSYKSISFSFGTPVAEMDKQKIYLKYKQDTTWKDIPFEIKTIDEMGTKYEILIKYNTDLEYQLLIDSAAVTDIYHIQNNKISMPFTVKTSDKYATLIVSMINMPEDAVIQLLDAKEVVYRQLPATEKTTFEFINPGDYFMRMFADKNKNSKWDTGNYHTNTQPEEVYYFNQTLKLKPNWEVEQEWDYKLTPAPQQKPEIIRKVVK